jgi:hypothetical protein
MPKQIKYSYVISSSTDSELGYSHLHSGARGSVVVKALCYKRKVAGSRPNKMSNFFQFS